MMLSLYSQGPRLCSGGMSRREWLRIGGLSAFGLALPQLAGAPGAPGKAKACIVLFLLGGPPQHETWDPKPGAPTGIKGEFKPIATSVPGLQVCELMPKTARLMNHICALRAVSTNDNAHSSSGYWMLTGVPHQPMGSENAKPGAPNDWPCTAAVVQKLRPGRNGLPASVVLPEHIWNDGNLSWPGQDGGFLGRSADPWLVPCDPSKPGFTVGGLALPADVPPERLGGRLALLERAGKKVGGAGLAHESRFRQAVDLVRAGRGGKAFRIDEEPDRLRGRYGRNRFGQSVLLARRLVEAGVSLVQVNWTRMKEDEGGSPAWDTHANNAKALRLKMPIMDAAYSALLEDLQARGLLESTLVVWMGEFGRTPRINGRAGRDHWGPVFCAALAGGGVRGGQALGSSDRDGAYPKDGRVLPQDLQATVFHALGVGKAAEVHDTLGRPIAATRGAVIPNVF